MSLPRHPGTIWNFSDYDYVYYPLLRHQVFQNARVQLRYMWQ